MSQDNLHDGTTLLDMARRRAPWSRIWGVFLAAATLLVALPPSASASPNAPDHPVPGEAALFGKLMAPCCWAQTLDVHAGPTADELRAEVRSRLAAGEPARSIEDDLVARYGPRILAEPKGSPLPWISLGMGVLALASAAGVVLLIRKWVRRESPAIEAPGATRSPTLRDAWDDRLDEELRLLDD